MRIDLHTHSDRSDGTLSPGDVVRAARAAALDVVALTDHDTAVGWDEAARAAEEVGVGFLPGMEISCRYDGRSVHLLGYLCDPSYPPLAAGLEEVLRGRADRLPRICAALRAAGVEIHEDEVLAAARGAAAVGRPHVADVLVSRGVVSSRDEAFERWLSPGRPAYVPRTAAPLREAVRWVRAAGGACVLAHPWGRYGSDALDADVLAGLRDEGLVGLEVDHQDHHPAQRRELRRIAEDLGLVVTGSSDFHGSGKVDHDLGCNLTDPAELARLLAAAGAAARASGRAVPTGVGLRPSGPGRRRRPRG